jgi:RNA polymerase sigma-70 factor (ECF subfamily)
MPVEDSAAGFEAAFRTHVRAVRAYALRRTAPEDAADVVADVVAETFAVAWRRWADAPEDPLPWLLGIARRVLANARRTSSRADRLAARVAAEPTATAQEPGDAIAEAEAVRAALSRLSPGDRETLMLVAWEQLDPPAAARAAGCSRATFAVRLHRARRRLAGELDAPPRSPHAEVVT